MDIIAKISSKFPTDIDKFHVDIERRKSLTDVKAGGILQSVFLKIDADMLSPELSLRYHKIKNSMC